MSTQDSLAAPPTPSTGSRSQAPHIAFLSGAVAGVANTLAGHPLDTLKVWAQTGQLRLSAGTIDLRALYRGLGPPLLTLPPLASLNFAVYEHAREGLWRCYPQLPPTLCAFLAGLCSGYLLCHVTNPMNVVKVQQQTGAAPRSDSMIRVAIGIVRGSGWRGLFQGYLPHAGMEGLGRASYMATYSMTKGLFGLEDARRGRADGPGRATGAGSLAARILCGSLAGMASWVTAYPFDVVRNNLMHTPQGPGAERIGAMECTRRILRTDGPAGLYRGLGFTLLRAGPVAAVTLPTYDLACDRLGRWLG